MMKPSPVTAAVILLIFAAVIAVLPCAECRAESSRYGGAYLSAAGDTLALPGEVFVLTAEELARFDINTIEDIIEHLPGVSVLQNGPPGSRTLYTIDGRTIKGMTMLVNGVPFNDPYNEDPLARFLALSRVRRIEVIYSSSPSLTGRASSSWRREAGSLPSPPAISRGEGTDASRARRGSRHPTHLSTERSHTTNICRIISSLSSTNRRH